MRMGNVLFFTFLSSGCITKEICFSFISLNLVVEERDLREQGMGGFVASCRLIYGLKV